MKCIICDRKINILQWILNPYTCEQHFWMKTDEEWKEINELQMTPAELEELKNR